MGIFYVNMAKNSLRLLPQTFQASQKTNKISGAESKEWLVAVKLEKPKTKC